MGIGWKSNFKAMHVKYSDAEYFYEFQIYLMDICCSKKTSKPLRELNGFIIVLNNKEILIIHHNFRARWIWTQLLQTNENLTFFKNVGYCVHQLSPSICKEETKNKMFFCEGTIVNISMFLI